MPLTSSTLLNPTAFVGHRKAMADAAVDTIWLSSKNGMKRSVTYWPLSPDLADAMGAMIHGDPTDLDWMPSRMWKELLRREKMKKGMDWLTKKMFEDTEVASRMTQGVQEGTIFHEQISQD